MKFLIILLLLLPAAISAQDDSCHLRVSLLTCTPGAELYSTFGHSALRITDSVSNSDIVYNYGTFNFDEPGFYTKFIRGKLSFYLSTDDFNSFKEAYREDKRGITEQVLNLNCTEKYNMLMLLQANLMAQNRFYKYDFTFDNCTTRLRDLVEKTADEPVHYQEVPGIKSTFRDLIYEYLNYNDKQWSKLGIDILLGSPLDVKMKPREVLFLPDYLMKSFDETRLGNRQLVYEKHVLLDPALSSAQIHMASHPLFIFTCVFLLIVLLTFLKNNLVKRVLVAFDGFIFFITGLLGLLMLFMWFGTDHIMCRNNLNLLWAWPTNVVAAFYIHSKKTPAVRYFIIYAMFSLVLFASWFFLPQHLNPALIPVIAILTFRSLWYVFGKNLLYEPRNLSE